MDWIWFIGEWFCIGVFGLMLLGLLLMLMLMAGQRLSNARPRKQFREHALFRTGADNTLIFRDKRLEGALNAIGPFEMDVWNGRREFVWNSPQGLTCDFAPFELIFSISPDNIGPDETTFELWDRYRAQHAAHIAEFKARLIELHRDVIPQIRADEALAGVRHLWIEVSQDGFGEAAEHELRAAFRLAWDEEHGHSLSYDPQAGTFGDWQE